MKTYPPASLLALLVAVLAPGVVPARAELSVQLFDAGTCAAAPLTSEALMKRDGWTLIPEDQTHRAFLGDAIIGNGKLVLALRQRGRGAELYAATPNGFVLQAELVAVGNEPARARSGLTIVENDPGAVILDATFQTGQGNSLTLRYELKPGQAFVQTQARSGARALEVVAPCRFAVLPDFFADDIVVDATELAASPAELPSDNLFMHLRGEGESIVMAVWHPAKDDIRIHLAGQETARRIASSEIPFAAEGKVWVAALQHPGVWHQHDIAAGDAGKILRLDWRAPFAAHWRVDWRRNDHLTDSWEMLTQKPDGQYVKHGWYGQPESFGNVDWQHEGRTRWTTVLGSFQYPCWIDQDGASYLQPLKKGIPFQGPVLLYPITRLEATPLEAFTIVDVMRSTLGVGPCEYILDVEGQKKTYQGRPTCASRTILDSIYTKKEQKEKQTQVQTTLDEVLAFVRHIRSRIEEYLAFGHTMIAYLEAQKQSRPELAGLLTELQDTTRKMDSYLAKRNAGIKTPAFATSLVEEFRTQLVQYEGADAAAKCKRITAALVDIGGNQDELVGECRMVVKILRQRAALSMATNPRAAPIAVEVRRRTQQMLRNPTSYEAPRH